MNGRSKILCIAALAASAAAAVTTASASDLGRCQTAQVPAPVVLPDGRVYDAGQVRVCLSVEYSPVVQLHEVSVNGRPIGLFPGRDYAAESGADAAPFLLLARDALGRLELRGYTARGRVHDLAPARSADGLFAVNASWQLLAADVRVAHRPAI